MSTLTDDGYVADWFLKAFEEMAEAYPAMRIRAGTGKIYAHALADLTREQITGAMGRAMLDARFFPSIAEIRSYVVAPAEDAALLAWAGLLDAAARIGGWQSLDVDDPCCAEALTRAAGSWSDFCELEGPGLAHVRQLFIAAYKDARRRPQSDGPVRLRGRCETSGNYQQLPAAWHGRLRADGRIEEGREQAALPASADVKRLTDGERSRDGEASEESGATGYGGPHDSGA